MLNVCFEILTNGKIAVVKSNGDDFVVGRVTTTWGVTTIWGPIEGSKHWESWEPLA